MSQPVPIPALYQFPRPLLQSIDRMNADLLQSITHRQFLALSYDALNQAGKEK